MPMLKRISTIFLAGIMLCTSMTCKAFADDSMQPISKYISSGSLSTPKSEVELVPKREILEKYSGAWRDDISTILSRGKIIKVWYQNNDEQVAYVRLYQLHPPYFQTEDKPVLFFAVKKGESISREYTQVSNDENEGIVYRICISTASGTTVSGNLLVTQFDETDTDTETIPFTDVPADAWYRPQLEYVYENGLFSGTSETTFSPEQDMTRAQIVTVLGNMHQKLTGKTIEADAPDFSDVQDGAYYAKYIDWAQKNGIVAGFSDGKFHPDDVITREQLAVIVNKYIQISGKTLTGSHEYTPFTDEDQISSWAKDAVVNLVKYGIMSGSNNQFAPKNGVIRAEGATVIADLHKTLV